MSAFLKLPQLLLVPFFSTLLLIIFLVFPAPVNAGTTIFCSPFLSCANAICDIGGNAGCGGSGCPGSFCGTNCFFVQCFPGGSGTCSPISNACPTPTPSPSFTLTASIGSCVSGVNQLNFSWGPFPGAQSYMVFRNSLNQFGGANGIGGTNGNANTTLTHTPLPGTWYYFVYAFEGPDNTIRQLGNTPIVGITTTSCATPPTVQTDPANPIGTTTATLNGTVISDNGSAITARRFYFQPKSGGSCTVANPTTIFDPGLTGAFSYNVTGLTANTLYCVQAVAYNSAGNGNGAWVEFTTTGPPGAFSSPLVASTSPGCSGTTPIVNLTWGASSGAASYTILRDGLAIVIGWTGTSYLDNSGLVTGTLYTYQIQAVNPLGSSLSNTASATALNCANPTVDLKANGFDAPSAIPSGASATLTWTSANATSCNATGTWATTGSKVLTNTSPGESTGTLGLPGPYTSTLTCTNGNIPLPPPEGIATKTAALPTGRQLLSCAQNSSTNLIYCFGGHDGTLLNQIVEYNPSTNTITTKTATLPTARYGLSCAQNSSTNLIYCFGGYDGTFLNQIVEYNPSTNTITTKTAALPTGKYFLSCAQNSSTNLIYCFGGHDGTFLNQIVEYTPPPPPPSAGNPASDSVTINITAPLPWIQTSGGDVHSNVEINTPGGP